MRTRRERPLTLRPRLLLPLAVLALPFAEGCSGSKDKADGADTTPPVPGQLLTVTSAGTTSAHLTWAAAEDDRTEAGALEYLAYSSTANALNTVAAVETNGTPIGSYAAGILQTDAAGLAPDTDYWFSVIVRDEAGNKASYTSVPVQTAAGCFADLPEGGCPTALSGKVTVCGRLGDVETDAFLEAPGATGAACPGTPPADGPCSMAITAYDAVDFASNPGAATPLAPASFYLDDCGRYRVENFSEASSGSFILAVDDALGTTDRHRLTIIASANAPANPAALTSLRAFVTRNATDTSWSTSAGLSGPTFADRGVVAAVFRYQGAGRSGVAFTRNGSTAPGDDYYFSDTGSTRSTVAAGLAVTGSSGGALFLNSTLTSHSGTGSEPPACQWPSRILASIAGGVFVQFMDAETNTGDACP